MEEGLSKRECHHIAVVVLEVYSKHLKQNFPGYAYPECSFQYKASQGSPAHHVLR